MSILIRITVHPHTCGVYSSMLQSRAAFCGPSPRARGLRPAQRWSCHPPSVHPHARRVYDPEWPCRLRQDRSIPTCVGFTRDSRRTASHRSGPSPHTWGLLLRRKRPLDPGRSIPTYVGFTLEPPLYHSLLAGPSPHTWGLLIDLIYQLLHVRSIPTYVGFTSSESRVTKIPSVHPHIRGVYKRVLGDIGCAPGPSPHTWGLLLDSLQRESQ